MPEIRLVSLQDFLPASKLDAVLHQLAEQGLSNLSESEAEHDDFKVFISEDELADFMDRLDTHELACDIYLPVEFEGISEISDLSFGSSPALLDILEELRDELNIDEDQGLDSDDPPEDDFENEMDLAMQQLKQTWSLFFKAATLSVEKQIPLWVIP